MLLIILEYEKRKICVIYFIILWDNLTVHFDFANIKYNPQLYVTVKVRCIVYIKKKMKVWIT